MIKKFIKELCADLYCLIASILIMIQLLPFSIFLFQVGNGLINLELSRKIKRLF